MRVGETRRVGFLSAECGEPAAPTWSTVKQVSPFALTGRFADAGGAPTPNDDCSTPRFARLVRLTAQRPGFELWTFFERRSSVTVVE